MTAAPQRSGGNLAVRASIFALFLGVTALVFRRYGESADQPLITFSMLVLWGGALWLSAKLMFTKPAVQVLFLGTIFGGIVIAVASKLFGTS
jgi:uncharacterized membrane protein YoaK (UPF0700 family)